jgi:hypothetical protein
MAAFTSVQSGNWNDGATWGNSSPGSKGTDWPGNAADTFTITAGHTVTYNVSETNELGASAINGLLTFLASMSTKLTLGNVVLTGNAGGELRIGTSDVPIDKAYTAELIFNTTSDATNNMNFANGFLYSIYGDSAYCSAWETTLANNAENTDSDNVIITNDDMSADWHNGDEIAIQREYVGDSSSYTDAVLKTSISGISGTTITVADNVTGMVAGVGDTWVSRVINVTRNVKIYKYGASTVVGNYNTNRPRFLDSTTGTNPNRISNAQITGFERMQMSGVTLTNVVIRNCNYALSSSTNNTLTSCNIYSNNSALYSSSNNNTLTGCNIYSNNYALYSSINNNLTSCNIYSNTYALYSSSNNNTLTSCNLGYDAEENSFPNTYDFRGQCINNYFLNCKIPAAGITYYDRNSAGMTYRLLFDHYNQTLDDSRLIDNKGEMVRTACDGAGTSPSVDPDGGSGDCVEASNLQSNLSAFEPIKTFNDFAYAVQAAASVSKTYTFKIQSIFTNTLANTEIILEASYLSGVGGAQTVVASTGTIATRGNAADWTQALSVTVNPAQAGFVFFQIKLAKYESGKKIYVWPKVAIS